MLTACALGMALLAGDVSHAQAQNFFAALFGGLSAPSRAMPPQQPFIYGDEQGQRSTPAPQQSSGGSGGAFCVRTCDGRYFPVASAGGQSRAETCNSFCPASETKVFYGSSIDNARADNGRAYSALPNAFRFRKELVSSCTCNGKDPIGLARIRIEDDRTLRRGDIVASGDGLRVATGDNERRKGASLSLSEPSASVRATFARMPMVAKDDGQQ